MTLCFSLQYRRLITALHEAGKANVIDRLCSILVSPTTASGPFLPPVSGTTLPLTGGQSKEQIPPQDNIPPPQSKVNKKKNQEREREAKLHQLLLNLLSHKQSTPLKIKS